MSAAALSIRLKGEGGAMKRTSLARPGWPGPKVTDTQPAERDSNVNSKGGRKNSDLMVALMSSLGLFGHEAKILQFQRVNLSNSINSSSVKALSAVDKKAFTEMVGRDRRTVV